MHDDYSIHLPTRSEQGEESNPRQSRLKQFPPLVIVLREEVPKVKRSKELAQRTLRVSQTTIIVSTSTTGADLRQVHLAFGR